MAVRDDARGVPTTASSTAAVALLDEAIVGFVSHRADTPARLGRALEADDQLVVALCMRGFATKLLARRDLVGAARDAHEAACRSIDTRGGTERERGLTDALGRWCADDPLGALAQLERVLRSHPHDLLAIKLSHAVYFLMGQTTAMRRSIERVLPAWSDAIAGNAFVLGCRAFTLVETGELTEAERTGRAAFERDRRDVWGAHAVVHAHEMTDQRDRGTAWLDGIDDGGVNNFAGHLAWHRALFLLAQGDFAGALREYDARIAVHLGRDYRDVGNASTLLWRLGREGIAVGTRWEAVADAARARSGEHSLAFADVHYALALSGAGDLDGARELVASMYAQAAERAGFEAEVISHCGAPLADAVVALAEGDGARAVTLLLPLRDDLLRLGGSIPQRAVFEHLLIEAAIAANDGQFARLILSERLSARPHETFSTTRLARLERVARSRRRALEPGTPAEAHRDRAQIKAIH